MLRKLVLTTTAAVIAAAPVAAQAAPDRVGAPVTAEASEFRGESPWIGVVAFLVGAGLLFLLWHDGDGDGPISP